MRLSLRPLETILDQSSDKLKQRANKEAGKVINFWPEKGQKLKNGNCF